MNKEYFLKELKEKTNLSEEDCLKVSYVLDETAFIFGKKNKEKLVLGFSEKLNINKDEAEKIYETSMGIIATGIKDKLKHPFKKD